MKYWKKKTDTNTRGHSLGEENKNEVENLIENAKDILKTREDIIMAYIKSKTKKMPNLIDLKQFEEDDGIEDDDDDNDDDKIEETNKLKKMKTKNYQIGWVYQEKGLMK